MQNLTISTQFTHIHINTVFSSTYFLGCHHKRLRRHQVAMRKLLVTIVTIQWQKTAIGTARTSLMTAAWQSWDHDNKNFKIIIKHPPMTFKKFFGCKIQCRLQLDWASEIRTQSYDKSKTAIGKLSARRIQIWLVYFCKIYFWPLFSK